MEKTQASAQPTVNQPQKTSTTRAVFAGILGVIAFLFFIPLVISLWINLSLLNSDNFSKTFTAVISSPKVSQQIATGITESIVTDDTVGDLSQSILTPEQAAEEPSKVKDTIKQVFNESLVKIIGSAQVQKTATNLLKNVHTIVISSPPKGATQATIDFRPFITAIIAGANGTKIAIISNKFTLQDDQGVFVIDQNQYALIQNAVSTARTTLIFQLVIFTLGVILAIIIANNRMKAFRRVLLTAGILLVLVGLPLYLIPMLMSLSSQLDISAIFVAVQLIANPLSIPMLIVGAILIIISIIIGTAFKSKKNDIVQKDQSTKKVDTKEKASEPKSAS